MMKRNPRPPPTPPAMTDTPGLVGFADGVVGTMAGVRVLLLLPIGGVNVSPEGDAAVSEIAVIPVDHSVTSDELAVATLDIGVDVDTDVGSGTGAIIVVVAVAMLVKLPQCLSTHPPQEAVVQF